MSGHDVIVHLMDEKGTVTKSRRTTGIESPENLDVRDYIVLGRADLFVVTRVIHDERGRVDLYLRKLRYAELN